MPVESERTTGASGDAGTEEGRPASRFRGTTALRLVRVDVESYLAAADPERTLDRSYVLAYEDDDDSFLSLLSSIQVVGREGTALGVSAGRTGGESVGAGRPWSS